MLGRALSFNGNNMREILLHKGVIEVTKIFTGAPNCKPLELVHNGVDRFPQPTNYGKDLAYLVEHEAQMSQMPCSKA